MDSTGVYRCTASNDVGEENCTIEVTMQREFGEGRESRPRSIHLTPNCHSDWWLLFSNCSWKYIYSPPCLSIYLPTPSPPPFSPQCSNTTGTALNLNWWPLVTTYAPTVMFHCHTNTFPERPGTVGVIVAQQKQFDSPSVKFNLGTVAQKYGVLKYFW